MSRLVAMVSVSGEHSTPTGPVYVCKFFIGHTESHLCRAHVVLDGRQVVYIRDHEMTTEVTFADLHVIEVPIDFDHW